MSSVRAVMHMGWPALEGHWDVLSHEGGGSGRLGITTEWSKPGRWWRRSRLARWSGRVRWSAFAVELLNPGLREHFEQ